MNKLTISGQNEIRWNGKPVTEGQLAPLLAASRKLDPEPELNFQPAVGADYAASARVLELIKNSGVSKFGFVGNELYSSSNTPSD